MDYVYYTKSTKHTGLILVRGPNFSTMSLGTDKKKKVPKNIRKQIKKQHKLQNFVPLKYEFPQKHNNQISSNINTENKISLLGYVDKLN